MDVLTVNSGYVLKDSDYPTVPYKSGYIGRWNKYTEPIDCNVRATATYVKSGTVIIPTQPTQPPGEIMSEDELEPVEADPVPAEASAEPGAASAVAAEVAEAAEATALSEREGQRLVSTQTVQHDYLTLNGKVARETITVDGTVTTVMDFIYDESGRPFALKYSTDGGATFTTYYYVLNLQGDVVKLVDPNGNSYAEYSYDAWGNITFLDGELAEINPLRYRGYYYDSETGFYYLINLLSNVAVAELPISAGDYAGWEEEPIEDTPLPQIAQSFGKFKCKEAAAAMVSELSRNKIHGTIIEIHYSGLGTHNNIYSDLANAVISENGFHCGVSYGGLVYCNVHPYGLPEAEWIQDFVGFGERTIIRIQFLEAV